MSIAANDLPRDVREILRRNHGVLLVADAAKVGVSESRHRRVVAANRLRRLGPGAYVDANGFVAVGEWQRFALKARAFALKSGPDSFLTGWGCIALRDYSTLGPPPNLQPSSGLRISAESSSPVRAVASSSPTSRRSTGGTSGACW